MLAAIKKLFSRGDSTKPATSVWRAIRCSIVPGKKEPDSDLSLAVHFAGKLGNSATAYEGGFIAEVQRRTQADWNNSTEKRTLERIRAIGADYRDDAEARTALTEARDDLKQLLDDPQAEASATLEANRVVQRLEAEARTHRLDQTYNTALQDAERAADQFILAAARQHREDIAAELDKRHQAALDAIRCSKHLDTLYACLNERRLMAERHAINPRDVAHIRDGGAS